MVNTTLAEHDSVIQKNIKTVHKIYSKLRTDIKTTQRELSHSNFQAYLIMCMREVAKYRLFGFEKKTICVEILSLLLLELGLPPVVAHYTAEVISDQVEHAYEIGMYRYKRRKPGRRCFIM